MRTSQLFIVACIVALAAVQTACTVDAKIDAGEVGPGPLGNKPDARGVWRTACSESSGNGYMTETIELGETTFKFTFKGYPDAACAQDVGEGIVWTGTYRISGESQVVAGAYNLDVNVTHSNTGPAPGAAYDLVKINSGTMVIGGLFAPNPQQRANTLDDKHPFKKQ